MSVTPDHADCDRCWLLTWTTYGTWLPGDSRGFVTPNRAPDGTSVRHNIPGTQFDSDIPALKDYARTRLRGQAVRLRADQAEALLLQFQETADVRCWRLFAAAVMSNHCHLVVGASGDPDPAKMLQGFKSYGSRKLNQKWDRPRSKTWWTTSGSRRILPNDSAILAAVRYLMNQEYPLLIWTTEIPELNLAGGRII